ncbi:fungal-specific transcription factor domain-containing protein [Microdochium trichocladiopsis]|uniref:Fungal-specific transcription factor domain-containing protein n=1 Tax=Microdochium trichocladiopsis TaxID=1682393 RepID=A0A9P9BS22_9PEZI|nr:fungal-specific transcription factor domain-containing protein [Microdochium trichocladiopsis]KAH7033551.1 fungal-specific transcription factor domain-containing protein [Microdochium trichocladiopsis]
MGKRKSCDLCTLKKIKCDGLAPSCSRCIDYGTRCSWTPGIHRRVRGPPKPKQGDGTHHSSSKPLVQLETRLAQLEEEVKRLRAATAAAPAGPVTTSPSVFTESIPEQILSYHHSIGFVEMSPRTKALPLPRHEDMQPVVDSYFANFNACYPLFDYATFAAMLEDYCGKHGDCRDEVTWAAISIVLALGLQSCSAEKNCFEARGDEEVHLRNVQSVLPRLLMRTEDLRGLQVLLGLSFYVQRSPESLQAQFLVASAVKLAYRLGLHTTQDDLPWGRPHASVERQRLLWLVYILDRDVSMSVKDPYMLQDHDLDMDIPRPFDSVDVVPALRGDKDAFFHCRIGLAHIQGKIYDYIFSARATRSPPEQRSAGLQTIWDMLGQWSAALPGEFCFETLHHTPTAPSLLLFFTYFRIMCKMQQVHSHNTDWMRHLIEYSSRWSIEFDPAAEPAACPLPSAPHWIEVVRGARRCMNLFHENPGSVVCWLEEVCCEYIAALVILVAHKLTVMEHHHLVHREATSDKDHDLIAKGIEHLQRMPEGRVIRRFDLYKSIARGCQELNSRADAAQTAFAYLRNTAFLVPSDAQMLPIGNAIE